MKRIVSASSELPSQYEFDGIIESYLSDNHVWVVAVYSDYDKGKDVLEISVEIDGDWKHDHLRADYLMSDYFSDDLVRTGEDMLDESDDDSYESRHIYVIENADKYFNINKLGD
jgi:hypothetical protein